MIATFKFQRGETIRIALDVAEGSPSDVSGISARMKRVMGGAQDVPVTVTSRAASGETPAGWDLTIDAETSAELPASMYLVDARLEIGADIVITDPVRVQLVEAVSA